MRYFEAWLGIVGLAGLACGGQSHGSEQTNAGGTVAKEPIAPGTTAGLSAGGGGAAGPPPSGGATTAGVANGGAESNGGSNVTEAGHAGAAGAAAGGAAGAGGSRDVAYPNPKPSAGCGKDATQAIGEFVKFTIQTSGKKDADCADKLIDGTPQCGDWTYPRDYYVWLPPNYKKQQPYPLVLQAPGCGGKGTDVYALSELNTASAAGLTGSVIRVGLTPPPREVGHSTNPNQGCFDDREGDDSVDWPFYEAVIDKLKTELCYDENRVFASGTSSGGWFANELGCKYAGNTAGYAIRGVAVSRGGLPTQPAFAPTCSNKPVSGMWVDEVNDATTPFASGDKVAIERAMQVNGCTTTFDTAQFHDFPIGAGAPDNECKKIAGCSEATSLVVCLLSGAGIASGLDRVANPGFSMFIRTFAAP